MTGIEPGGPFGLHSYAPSAEANWLGLNLQFYYDANESANGIFHLRFYSFNSKVYVIKENLENMNKITKKIKMKRNC